MTLQTFLRRFFVVALAISALGCGLEAQSSEIPGGFERTLAVSDPVTVDVRTGSGSIVIRSGAENAVRVVARIRGRQRFGGDVAERVRQIEANPPVQLGGGTVRIGHLSNDLARDIRISYEITTPADTTVMSQSGAGDQTIADVRGPVAASTGAGSVDVRRIQMDVRVSTGAGDVSLGGIPGGNWNVQTMAGSVDVNVPADAAFELNARTRAGRVDVSAPIALVEQQSERVGPVTRVRGTVRGGGPLVDIFTAAGTIHIQ
jgi:hypothetical protein